MHLPRAFHLPRHDWVELVFTLLGVRLFLDWLLITNPVSKNPLIRRFWGWNRATYPGGDPAARLRLCFILGGCHVPGLFGPASLVFHPLNIYGNIYPILVQCYLGYRCLRVINHQKSRTKLT